MCIRDRPYTNDFPFELLVSDEIQKLRGIHAVSYTHLRVMEKSVPGSGPQFYFVFREDKLIGYNFLIGDTKRDVYKRQ